jgi:hypothetical protein
MIVSTTQIARSIPWAGFLGTMRCMRARPGWCSTSSGATLSVLTPRVVTAASDDHVNFAGGEDFDVALRHRLHLQLCADFERDPDENAVKGVMKMRASPTAIRGTTTFFYTEFDAEAK